MNNTSIIPYGRQSISEADIQAVVDVLRSNYLTQGPVVPDFEYCVANYCQSRFAVAVNSATSALHIACLALEVGPGDMVWTTPITFVASANCAIYCGAKVDFVDIDKKTFNLCPNALENKLIKAQKNGTLPKVVIPVHMTGQPCDMKSIYALSLKYNFKIIEDASHAIGAKYLNEPVGNCRFSDITVFSFHPVKIITTAEGGMALTNQDTLNERMLCLRSHGITRETSLMTHIPDGPWYYEQNQLGFNYRMTEIQAALGISQMKSLDIFIEKRQEIAKKYQLLLMNLPIDLPFQSSDSYSSFHLFIVQINTNKTSTLHLDLFNFMLSSGIGVNLHYIPVHLQPFYSNMGFKANDFPNALSYYKKSISIPIFSGLQENEQKHVIETLEKGLSK